MTTLQSPGSNVRFAIAGLGQHAGILADALEEATGAELVFVASRSTERAAEFAQKHSVPEHGTYDDALERKDVDALIVATANHLHRDLTLTALERGMHVFCEKPMALTMDDAGAMEDAASRHGRSIFVGYYLRFLDVIMKMRNALGAGEIGVPLDLRLQRYSQHTLENLSPWRRDIDRAGAGVLCDVAVHLVDLITFVTGEEILSVQATSQPPRATHIPDDHTVLVLRLGGGGIATVNAARGVRGGENDFHIHGSLGGLCTGSLRWVDTHELTEVSGDHVRKSSFPSGRPYARQMEGIVAALHGDDRTAIATAHDGIRGVRILTAAMHSLETGRTVQIPSAKEVKP